MNLIMTNFDLNEDSKSEMRAFYKNLQPARSMQTKLDNLMECLPQSCQTLLVGSFFRPMLFANRPVILFLLKTFKNCPHLMSRVKNAQAWKFANQ